MIAIRNISTGSPFGWQDYEVRINHELICTFRHKREEGLAVCLKMASAAVGAAQWTKTAEILLAVQTMKEKEEQ